MSAQKITEKWWEKSIKAALEKISTVSAFEGDTKKKQSARKKDAENLNVFCRTYFPHYFSLATPPFAEEWSDISKMRNTPVLVEASREFGKSTFFTLADPLYHILFEKEPYILIGSYVEEKAELFTAFIKLELERNPRIRHDFGDVLDEKIYKDSFGFFVTSTNIAVHAISIGQDPRGLRWMQHRPKYLRADDIQNRKRAQSEKFVDDTMDWLHADFIPALTENYSLVVVGTPMNPNCVVNKLRESLGWKSYRYPALDNKGRPLWPEKHSEKSLEKRRKTIGLRNFNREYLLITDDEDSDFKEAWIECVEPKDIPGDLITVCWYDPSGKNAKQNDPKAIIVLGFSRTTMKFYVLHAYIRRVTIARVIDVLYDIYEKFSPRKIFYEETGGQQNYEEVFRLAGELRGMTLPVEGVNNTVNKEDRIINTLQSPIEKKEILFIKGDSDQGILIDQLLGRKKEDDGPDALEGAYRKLREMARRLNTVSVDVYFPEDIDYQKVA